MNEWKYLCYSGYDYNKLNYKGVAIVQLINEYKSGTPIIEIAQMFAVSVPTIYRILRENGYSFNKTKNII